MNFIASLIVFELRRQNVKFQYTYRYQNDRHFVYSVIFYFV